MEAVVKSESNHKAAESNVLNISGRPQRQRPKKRSSRKPAPPVDTFPLTLSSILLKSDSAPTFTPSSEGGQEFLGVLCLENQNRNVRLYHMFCTTYDELGNDYYRVGNSYANQSDFRVRNQISIQTICARSLYRSAQKRFQDYKWNKKGNVFETHASSDNDEWSISAKLHELHQKELEKLFNYLKFLYITKN